MTFIDEADVGPPSASSCCRKLFDPERAMVPRFSTRSSLVMPTPLSWIVSVFASGSQLMRIAISLPSSAGPSDVSEACLRFSSASDEFETSSRTKTSLSV